MKITVITSTYNCVSSIDETIKSISAQRVHYPNLQWIIIDGASNDGTISKIKSTENIFDVLISEPDSGIYDAWNKAIPLISGDWVIFMGAGDTFVDANTLKMVSDKLACISYKEHAIVFGGVNLVNSYGEVIEMYTSVKDNDWSTGRPSLPPHQGTFQHISNFKRFKFDSTYKIAADSKFLISCLKNTKLKSLGFQISNMDFMGVSTNPRSILKTKRELSRLRNELGLKMPIHHQIKFNLKCYIKYFVFGLLNYDMAKKIANSYRKLTGRGAMY